MLPLVRDPKGRTRGNPGGRERRLPGQAGGLCGTARYPELWLRLSARGVLIQEAPCANT